MKIFQHNPNDYGWGNKINFVDEANTFIGFDYSSSCCESFGYFLTRKVPTTQEEYDDLNARIELPEAELAGYNFDRSFFEQQDGFDGDSGGDAFFRLHNGKGEALYLCIYNHHNGYYGHGFEVKHGGEVVKTGTL